MRRYPLARDKNEKEIVAALVAAGATVERLDGGRGLPDLLVGYRGVTILVEVKGPVGPSGGTTHTHVELNDRQRAWWAAWQGAHPHLVRSVDDALALLRSADEALAMIIEEPTDDA